VSARLPEPLPEEGPAPAAALVARLEALTAFLQGARSLWEHRPFVAQPAPWEADEPALASWLRGLTPAAVEAGEGDPEALTDAPPRFRALAAEARRHAALPSLPRPAPSPAPRRVSARKWTQIDAFAGAALPRLAGAAALTDWCAGKGHLGRTLALRSGLPFDALERDEALCRAGEALARRAGARARFHAVDVTGPLPGAALGPGRALVALHACGSLSRRALTEAVAGGAGAVAVAPCCFQRVPGGVYRPLSRLGQALDLGLTRRSLWLPCSEEVVARPRQRRLRVREMVFRAALDQLLRQASGSDIYRSFPPIPGPWISGPFAAFAEQMAARHGLSLPPFDPAAAERAGEAWVHTGRALALARVPFRRPIEVWLALDRALYLAEAGWEVRLGVFCDRAVTPRNVLILGRR
jgi:hypothetical protein